MVLINPQTIVTPMDEPLYVMISASNKDDLEAAVAMVSAVFTKLDHARRLMADLVMLMSVREK